MDYGSSGGGAFGAAFLTIYLVVLLIVIIAGWQVFTKAGKPGWAVLIPFYNAYVLLKIVGRPGWWLILYFIPLVNIVIWIIVDVELAKSFGKGVGFAIGLIFLPYIFIPILAFGSARYLGPAALGLADHTGRSGTAVDSAGGPPPPPATSGS